MNGFKVIIILAVMLGMSAIVLSGIAAGQTFMVDKSGNIAFPYFTDSQNTHQDNSLTDVQASPAYADGAASGQSIIYENGVPTTVIGANGVGTKYSESMWDFMAGYNANGEYGVGISSNPDVPIGGTWKQVTQSGTLGTQEPNLNLK